MRSRQDCVWLEVFRRVPKIQLTNSGYQSFHCRPPENRFSYAEENRHQFTVASCCPCGSNVRCGNGRFAMRSLKWERELDTPLSASASNAGAIFANNVFEIPRFQREYSWGADEVEEFWTDLKGSLDADSYFLGLIILTKPQVGQDDRKQVVDGQQRIITLSLLANAIYHEAVALERKALADRVQASFLRSIDYDTDEEIPRVKLRACLESHA